MKKILIILAVCVLTVGTLLGLNFVDGIPYRELVYSGISALYLVVGSIALRVVTRKTSVVKYFNLKPFRVRDTFIFIWMLLATISGSYLFNFAEFNIWALFNVEMPVSDLSGMSTGNVWLMFLAVGIIPAVFEELFFRGAVTSSLRDNGQALAIFVSAGFFFLIHGSVFGSLSTIFAGVCFGLLTLVTGSIFAAMLAHLLNNMITYLLNLYAARLSVVGLEGMIVYALTFVFLLSAYFALSCIYKKLKKESHGKNVTVYNEGELVWEKQRELKGKSAKDL